MTCLLAKAPRLAESRDPARPARATAMLPSTSASSEAFRAYRLVSPSTCSANALRLQPGAVQENRRTPSRISTCRPSASRRE